MSLVQIRTERRDRIPKDHGFPLSSKRLSEALGDVPQFSELKVVFRFKDEYLASSYQKRVKSQEEIKVLLAKYTHPEPHNSSSISFIESGYYSPTWRIEVVELPKEYLFGAKEILSNVSLPLLRNWLVNVGLQTDHKMRSIVFTYTLYKKSVSIES
jgi:hypothetical protein